MDRTCGTPRDASLHWNGDSYQTDVEIADLREDRAPAHLLYWSETTAGQPFETGIQRVVRRLALSLREHGIGVVDVGWNSKHRRLGRLTDDDALRPDASRWLLIPEVPVVALTGGIDPVQVGKAHGLKVAAIVHDLIPIKLAHDYDDGVRDFYETYYAALSAADLLVTTTHHVASDLLRYLRANGLATPEIVALPLPAQFAGTERRSRSGHPLDSGRPLRVLTVSSWEPRKNLPHLLHAVGRAQARNNRSIEVTLVGKRAGFSDYDAEIEAIMREMPNVVAAGSVSDADLLALHETHDLSIYPSYEEGFGMPILESLWLGTPCLCHDGSSMAEVAPGGGTMAVDMRDETALLDALLQLTTDDEILPNLVADLTKRPLRSWADYGRAFATTLGLSRHAEEAPAPSIVPV